MERGLRSCVRHDDGRLTTIWTSTEPCVSLDPVLLVEPESSGTLPKKVLQASQHRHNECDAPETHHEIVDLLHACRLSLPYETVHAKLLLMG